MNPDQFSTLDPELADFVAALPEGFMDLDDVDQARAALIAMVPDLVPEALDRLDIEDRSLGADAGSVRIYRPHGTSSDLPGLLYIHGGGFVFGSVETDHLLTSALADAVGAVLVSVDYRLAPEHPFPAGLDDCYAALELLAYLPGVDPSRIAVHGASAGAALAAGVALLSRDRGGPAIRLQSLDVPVLDDRLQTPSMTAFVDTPIWNRSQAQKSWKHYLAGRPADGYAAPARTGDLSGLPPTYLVTGELDPLRDEGIAYATRLLEAGVSVELHQFPGTFHGSTAVPQAAISRRMHDELVVVLRRALSA